MIFEKFPHSLDEDILLKTRLQYFLNLPLRPRLQYRCLLLEQHAHTVQGEDLQRPSPDDAIKDQKELLRGNIPDKAVEDPREHDPQGLDM